MQGISFRRLVWAMALVGFGAGLIGGAAVLGVLGAWLLL
jgi:hypothetical protein